MISEGDKEDIVITGTHLTRQKCEPILRRREARSIKTARIA